MNKMQSTCLTFVVPLCLLLTGCPQPSDIETGRIESPEAFYEQVTVPERLYIDVDFERMSTLTSVKQYTGETMDMDQEKLVKAFFKDRSVEKSSWADGVTYAAKDGDITEYLNVDDGGESFGTPTDAKGGFYYIKMIGNDDPNRWGQVACQDFKFQNVAQNEINSDYRSKTDLGFLPYDQTVNAIFDVLHKADLPDLVIDETYSLDLATMTDHYQKFLKDRLDRGGLNAAVEPEEWTTEDECYLFSLQQLVGELPVVNKGWMKPEGATTFDYTMPATGVKLTYDQNGIRYINEYNLLRIVSEGEPVELISGYDALKALVDEYANIIIEQDIHIVTAQLCYLLYPVSEDQFSFALKPGWIFSSRAVIGDLNLTEYRIDVVDAVTGDLHPGRF